MKSENVIKLIFSISICQFAGVVGSIFTSPSIPVWYATLQKPYFSPPNWIFAPVWILLFTLMGISLYLILKENLNDRTVKIGIAIFSFQLILNISWSFLFFTFQNILYALFEIIILWFAILLTIYQFWKINKKSSYLLIPYLLWVTFAAILNFTIWILNI
ncbi:MAG: tryptophan-rich sensory protein [Methanosarcinaceae archaeon]|nr:tryptophan-rich sensory protein [Methanosarcinaceae archaeon]